MKKQVVKDEYEIIVNSLIVKPKGEPIFSELATYISIEDEAAGPFVIIKQHNDLAEKGEIRIDVDEWPCISKAVIQMLDVCRSIGKTESIK